MVTTKAAVIVNPMKSEFSPETKENRMPRINPDKIGNSGILCNSGLNNIDESNKFFDR